MTLASSISLFWRSKLREVVSAVPWTLSLNSSLILLFIHFTKRLGSAISKERTEKQVDGLVFLPQFYKFHFQPYGDVLLAQEISRQPSATYTQILPIYVV